MNRTFIRIILDILIFLSVLQGWWLFVLLFGVVGAWKYSFFIEFVIAGIVFDSLFGLVPERGVGSYLATILSLILTIAIGGLGNVIRK
jgi:hypothetical protein